MSRLLGGRYEIIEKIGEGGMAVVYKAKCHRLQRYVAIKILKPEFLEDRKFIENFRQESQAAGSLNDPNIVGIYDVGTEGQNIHYIVMEYVEGETLSSIIERLGRLPEELVIDFSKQIASALSCAHRNKIIHRDVKPHNILVTEDGVAKITDFGIARAVSSTTLVASDAVMGSVHYFSPEQARGGYVDEKSDVYSLGIMMYEMITGNVPFDGDNPVTVAMMHLNKSMPLPSRENPSISPGLEEIILKATEKYQVNRYQSADELLEALKNLEMTDYVNFSDSVYSEEKPAEEDTNDDAGFKSGASSKTIVIPIAEGAMEKTDESEKNGNDEIKAKTGSESDNFEYYEFDVRKNQGNSNSGRKKNKRKQNKQEPDNSRKSEKKKGRKKKKIITLPRVFGIIIGIALAVLCTMGIMWGKEYISLDEVTVPDILGMNYEEAQATLEGYGLKMEIVDWVYSPVYEKDQVCEQTPKAQKTVKEGYLIRVSVSKGSGDGTGMPSFIGMTLEEATAAITAAGYQLGTVETRDDSSAEGTVIAQTPEYAAQADPGTVVNLVVSNGKGKAEIVMMPLVGNDLDTATSMIKNANLVLDNVEYKFSTEFEKGIVMEQNVSAGDTVVTGTKISLVVSKGRDLSKSSGGEVKTIGLVLDYNKSANDVFEVKINMVQDGVVTLLHNGVHYKSNNGEKIDVSGSGQATLLIYFDGKLVSEGAADFESGTFNY